MVNGCGVALPGHVIERRTATFDPFVFVRLGKTV
jgi:hypothetical protein